MIHYVFYYTCRWKGIIREVKFQKYAAVLILGCNVHTKCVHTENECVCSDSLFEMPIVIDILISEESPYFSQ